MDTWIMLFSRLHQQDCVITHRNVTITVLRPWKKVVFAAKHNAGQVKAKLEDAYPKLRWWREWCGVKFSGSKAINIKRLFGSFSAGPVWSWASNCKHPTPTAKFRCRSSTGGELTRM